jgi:hypothetical protein
MSTQKAASKKNAAFWLAPRQSLARLGLGSSVLNGLRGLADYVQDETRLR